MVLVWPVLSDLFFEDSYFHLQSRWRKATVNSFRFSDILECRTCNGPTVKIEYLSFCQGFCVNASSDHKLFVCSTNTFLAELMTYLLLQVPRLFPSFNNSSNSVQSCSDLMNTRSIPGPGRFSPVICEGISIFFMRQCTKAQAVAPCLKTDMSLPSGISQHYNAISGWKFHTFSPATAWKSGQPGCLVDLKFVALSHTELLISFFFHHSLCLPDARLNTVPHLWSD